MVLSSKNWFYDYFFLIFVQNFVSFEILSTYLNIITNQRCEDVQLNIEKVFREYLLVSMASRTFLLKFLFSPVFVVVLVVNVLVNDDRLLCLRRHLIVDQSRQKTAYLLIFI